MFNTPTTSFLPIISSPRSQNIIRVQVNGHTVAKTNHRNSGIIIQKLPSSPQSATRSQFSSTPTSLKSTVSDSTPQSKRNTSISLTPNARESGLRSLTCLPSIQNKNNSMKSLFSVEAKKACSAEIHSEESMIQTSTPNSARKNREECEARYSIIEKAVDELNSMDLIDEVNAKNLYTSSYVTKTVNKAIKLAEHVLANYGIEVRSCVMSTSDSAMSMTAVAGKVQIANFYMMFIPELCKFNYVFLSNLRIGTITVCQDLELLSKQHAAVIDKKLHSGLFVMGRMNDRKSIQQHWYKVLLYHFLKVVPDFYVKWRDFIWRNSKINSKSSPFEELQVTFHHLMETSQDQWDCDSEAGKRVGFLREALQECHFDSNEITEWDE